MFERREGAKRCRDAFGCNAKRKRARGCDQGVFRVMGAFDQKVRLRAQTVRLAAKRHREHAVRRDERGVLRSAPLTHVARDAIFGADGDVVVPALGARHPA